MPQHEVTDADLQDDGIDDCYLLTCDLMRPARQLAAAVLLRAAIDSKLQDPLQPKDAEEFLNPRSIPARYHFSLMAEIANGSPAWSSECIARCANSPLPEIRQCGGYKAKIPGASLVPRYEGGAPRLCRPCHEATPYRAGRRRVRGRSGSRAWSEIVTWFASLPLCLIPCFVHSSRLSGRQFPSAIRLGCLRPFQRFWRP
jgi:hypothetical protein